MSVIQVLALAVGLGMDAMSVCMAVGVRWHGPRQKFRLAWHMGLFQFLMPVLGWALGSQLAEALRAVGTYVAAAMVFGIGAKMLYEVIRSRPGAVAEEAEHAAQRGLGVKPKDPTRGWSLVGLSVATSIDALVAGFSIGIRDQGIWLASLIIGLVAGLMALAGVVAGKRIGSVLGRPAEVVGAVVLMALAVSFLVV
ncbi:MAG: manganese efflux pump MntP [Planctomycetota bacterium]|jgi:putative Mn2+ efflux pump MntP